MIRTTRGGHPRRRSPARTAAARPRGPATRAAAAGNSACRSGVTVKSTEISASVPIRLRSSSWPISSTTTSAISSRRCRAQLGSAADGTHGHGRSLPRSEPDLHRASLPIKPALPGQRPAENSQGAFSSVLHVLSISLLSVIRRAPRSATIVDTPTRPLADLPHAPPAPALAASPRLPAETGRRIDISVRLRRAGKAATTAPSSTYQSWQSRARMLDDLQDGISINRLLMNRCLAQRPTAL